MNITSAIKARLLPLLAFAVSRMADHPEATAAVLKALDSGLKKYIYRKDASVQLAAEKAEALEGHLSAMWDKTLAASSALWDAHNSVTDAIEHEILKHEETIDEEDEKHHGASLLADKLAKLLSQGEETVQDTAVAVSPGLND